MPIDIAILKTLPDEGSMKGQYLWDAREAKTLAVELGEGITSYMVMGRLTLMRGHKLVIDVPMVGRRSLGWQRTAEALRLLSSKE
jgi:hypothetical protein